MPSTKRSSPVRSWADATPAYVGSSINDRHINRVITTNAIRSRRGVWRTVPPLLTPSTLDPDPLRLCRAVLSHVLCAGLGLLLPPSSCEGAPWILKSLDRPASPSISAPSRRRLESSPTAAN